MLISRLQHNLGALHGVENNFLEYIVDEIFAVRFGRLSRSVRPRKGGLPQTDKMADYYVHQHSFMSATEVLCSAASVWYRYKSIH